MHQAIARDPLIASPDTRVHEAIALMQMAQTSLVPAESMSDPLVLAIAEARASCVLVVEHQQLIGIFTERDLVQNWIKHPNLADLPLSTVMAAAVSLPQEQLTDVGAVLTRLQHHQRRHLAIIDSDGVPLGVVTQASVLQALNALAIVEDLTQQVTHLQAEQRQLIQTTQLHLEHQVQERTLELQQQTEREQLFNRVASRIRASLQLSDILNAAVTEVRQFLHCDRVLTYQFRDDGVGVVVAESVAEGWTASIHNLITDPCFSQRAAQSYAQGKRQAVANVHAAGYPDCYLQLLDQYQVKANLVVPILVENQLWGLLIGHHCADYRVWQTPELDFLDLIAVQLAIAIQQANAYERSQTELAERQRREQEISLLYTITQALHTVDDFEAALEVTLRQICEFTQWSFGEVWLPSDDGAYLQLGQPWYSNNPATQAFRNTCRSIKVAPGFGLPGRVWATQQPEWIEDIETSSLPFSRYKAAHSSGLRSGLGVPILANDGGVAVLVLFAPTPRELDISLLQLITSVTTQLGQIIRRKQLENALSISETQLSDILNRANTSIVSFRLSSDYVWTYDYYSAGCEAVFGYTPQEMMAGIWWSRIPLEDQQSVIMANREQILAGESMELHYRFRHKNGSLRWITTLLTAQHHPTENYWSVIAVDKDMTDYRQALENLRQSEEQFRGTFEQAAVGMCHVSLGGQFLQLNQRFCEIIGYSSTELVNMTFQEITVPEDLVDDLQHIQALLNGEISTYTIEKRYVHKTGRIVWVNLTVSLLRSVEGEPQKFISVIEDISARKQAEENLRQSESKHRALISALPDLIMRMSGDGIYLDFFPTETFKVFGDTDLVGLGIEERGMPLDLAQRRMNYIRQALQTGKLQVYEQNIQVDDEWRTEEVRITVCGDDEVLVIVRDITDRKRMEESLRQSEAKNRAILAAIPDLMFRISADGRYLGYVTENRRIDLLPTSINPVGQFMSEVLPPEIAQRQMACVQEALLTNELQIYEQQISMNGKLQYEEIRAVTSGDNEVLFMIRDITDRKQTELALHQLNQELEVRVAQRTMALRDSEERFRQIFEQSPIGIAISDLSGCLTRVNVSLAYIMDCSITDLLQQSIQDLFPRLHGNLVTDALQDLIEHTVTVLSFESQSTTRLGQPVWVNITSALILNAFGRPSAIVHLIEDISDRKQAEAELLRVNSLQQAILNGTDYSIISTDTDGVIQTFNATAEQMLGYTATEMIGIATPECIHDPIELQERAQLFSVALNQPIASGMDVLLTKARQGLPSEAEWIYVRKDGTSLPVLLSVTALRDPQGNITGFVGIAKDITHQKQADEQLRRTLKELSDFKYALDEAVIVAITDAKGVITYANKRFCEISGYSYDELIGQTHYIINSAHHSKEFFEELWKTIASGQVWRGEILNQAKDGTLYWVDTTVIPFLDEQNKPWQYLAIRNDISDRKQAEEQLRQANEQLILSNADLARATRLKDEFLANMSHELRTPLNAILGMSEGLQEAVFGEVNSAQRRAIATIERSGRHLLDLINDILDLSKIESGTLELQIAPISVQYLCESSLMFVRQQALRKNINLTLNLPDRLPGIAVDERRIRQVLINLLTNAVKFTPDGGTVGLSVSTLVGEGDCSILFSVTDTGIGIAPENIDRLFQPFVQLDSSLARQHAGTGLGLSLVRQLVNLHDGKVGVTSTPHQGSCFTVQLPYTCVIHAEPIATHPTPATDNTEVLIIEGSTTATDQVVRYLTELGLRATAHSSGVGALEAALRIRPALIILDVLLPGLSGWDVLAQLKTHSQLAEIPVVVLSVLDERSRGLALGASEYLIKPISREQLHRVLHQFYPLPSSEPLSRPVANNDQVLAPLILLAEDNEANIATLSGYLGSRGYRLVTARNGQEAITSAQTLHPDLILMDIQMPEMDGLEAIRCIRADHSIAATPIIALTALAMPGDREHCLLAGASDYFTKPVKLKQLVDTIQRLLGCS